jgi:hypothetical protein
VRAKHPSDGDAGEMARLAADDGTACLLCRTWYSTVLRPPRSRCGDLSQGQRVPCPGRVIPWAPQLLEFLRPPAETS